MKAYGHLSERVGMKENFVAAHMNASRNKRRRQEVIDFGRHIDDNACRLLELFQSDSYKPSPYEYKTIHDRKDRFLSMLPYEDHVYHWGILQQTEELLMRSMDERSYACVLGRGQHAMVRQMSYDIRHDASLLYYASLDVAKMYPSIPLDVPKQAIRRKIKDKKILHFFDTVIDSSIGTPMGNGDLDHPTGIPIGLKVSTIIANMSLAGFDHDARRLFGLADNPRLIDAMASQYVADKIATARLPDDERELAKGSSYLASRFATYARTGIRYYYRFMDNVFILHEDKTFLHLLCDWIGLYWGAELGLTINAKWQVGALTDGLTAVGYRIFADGHVRASKEVKEAVKRKILRGRRMGLSDEQIRRKVSSQLGTMMHANSRHFIQKYHMEKRERLGAKINKRKSQCPFDMAYSQQRRFESLLYNPAEGEEEKDFLMELRDFEVINSIKEFNDDGSPKKCLAIRFEWQGGRIAYTNEKGKEVLVLPGEEYYAYTGSRVLIEQTATEFSKEDLPASTVITVAVNAKNKKFYKFT